MKLKLEEIMRSPGRVRVLEVMVEAGELNISEIARRTSLDHEIADKYLISFVQKDILEENRFGRIRIFRWRRDDDNARLIFDFIEKWHILNS